MRLGAKEIPIYWYQTSTFIHTSTFQIPSWRPEIPPSAHLLGSHDLESRMTVIDDVVCVRQERRTQE